MKRLTKTIMMLSPFSLAGLIWEPPLTEGMREIREGNFDRAAEIFEDAAGGELNLQEAVYGRALCYWFGIGVEQDQKQAVKLLEEDKMSPLNMENGPEKQTALHILGLYYMGQRGVKTRKKGIEYMREAATSGHAASQFHLGRYYYRKYERGTGNTIEFQDNAMTLLTQAMENPKLSKKCKNEAKEYLDKLPEKRGREDDDSPNL